MWSFDNQLLRELPIDPLTTPGTRQVAQALSLVEPTPVADPKMLAYSEPLAAALGFDAAGMRGPEMTQILAGNQLADGMQPWALNYGGHQFGHWAGQLGDGRAISLGELIAPDQQRWELQLKGAGPTPYSRHADGRAVLRSSLREFICSEAMHALGVPTTRALSLISTGESVLRDMFYDGNPELEPGAIVCRVAPSFIRFGCFELPSKRGDRRLLEQWLDACLRRDFPHLSGENRYADWFVEVCERTAVMVAHWLRVGFVHGVMNTDNMSVLGLTIDYGPYGWLEPFAPGWTPNITDRQHARYAFGRQAEIAYWNLGCLAQAIAPLFADVQPLHAGMQRFQAHFNDCYQRAQADKFGLLEPHPGNQALQSEFYALMHAAELDFGLSFLALGGEASEALQALAGASYNAAAFSRVRTDVVHWLERYWARLGSEQTAAHARMASTNPIYVPRNYLAQQAIDAAQAGDLSELHTLIAALSQPYTERAEFARFAEKRPEWARERAGCSMLSCSS